jgi:hypothetical protein
MAKTQENVSDIKIELLELVTPTGVFDLQKVFVSMNIYEDLFGDSVTVDILLNDSINLPNKAPILGEEYLNFSIFTKSVDGEGNDINPGPMYSVSITNRHLVKDRQQLYLLHFTSEQDIVNSNTTVSRSFRGKKISQIVNTLLNDYIDPEESGNDFVIEETVGIENIVIPNWKPFKAINWLAKRAINKNNVPNYLFWESNGITYFKSVETLLTQQVKQKFIFSPIISSNQKIEKLALGRIQLDNLEIINQFNTIRNIENGLYASKLITHDIVKKKIQQHTYGLNKAYASDITHTDVYMPISSTDTYYTIQDRSTFAPQEIGNNQGDNIQSYYDSKVMFHPKHDRMYSINSTDLYDNNVEEWKLKRNTLILGLDQIKLKITFSGISYLSVGNTIDITVPSPEKVLEQNPGKVKNTDDLVDKYLSGTYLITALRHMIAWNNGKPVYTMVAEVTKDALGDVPSYRGKNNVR